MSFSLGLRFCVLKKDVGDSDRRRPSQALSRPRPAPKVVQDENEDIFATLDFDGGSGASGQDLLNAVLNGHIEEAKQLIKDGADVNAEDQHGRKKWRSSRSESFTPYLLIVAGNSVLHIAAQNGRDQVVPDLLLKGADINKGNNHKNTALHLGKY